MVCVSVPGKKTIVVVSFNVIMCINYILKEEVFTCSTVFESSVCLLDRSCDFGALAAVLSSLTANWNRQIFDDFNWSLRFSSFIGLCSAPQTFSFFPGIATHDTCKRRWSTQGETSLKITFESSQNTPETQVHTTPYEETASKQVKFLFNEIG